MIQPLYSFAITATSSPLQILRSLQLTCIISDPSICDFYLLGSHWFAIPVFHIQPYCSFMPISVVKQTAFWGILNSCLHSRVKIEFWKRFALDTCSAGHFHSSSYDSSDRFCRAFFCVPTIAAIDRNITSLFDESTYAVLAEGTSFIAAVTFTDDLSRHWIT